MGTLGKSHSKMFEQLLGPGHEAVNALLGPMPKPKPAGAGAQAAPTSMGYIKYGNGMFDGQGSGHDFYGNLYAPSIGWRNHRWWPLHPLPGLPPGVNHPDCQTL